MNPAISVVMAVYEGLRFLPAQVASMRADLQPQDEIVVVDDASTDGSAAWLAALPDSRIRIHRNTVNLGVRCSFELGMRLATNEFIFLCDQDDEWIAGKREAFVDAFLVHPDCMVVVSDAILIDDHSKVFDDSFMRSRGGFRQGFWANLYRNRYLGCAMAVRRRLVVVALPIPAHVPMHDMWLGMLGCLMGKVVYLPATWIRYRRHDSNVTPSTRRAWWRVLLWRINLLRAVIGRLPTVAAASCAANSGTVR